MMLMRYYFLIFTIKAYVVSTRLNCFDIKAIQMSTRNICFDKEVDKSTQAEI